MSEVWKSPGLGNKASNLRIAALHLHDKCCLKQSWNLSPLLRIPPNNFVKPYLTPECFQVDNNMGLEVKLNINLSGSNHHWKVLFQAVSFPMSLGTWSLSSLAQPWCWADPFLSRSSLSPELALWSSAVRHNWASFPQKCKIKSCSTSRGREE